ncbi:hypothetical protein [Litorimonas sp. WD9-15]|uniref:hypothetical protein n=1 Tax=Litorimonas sp. WD9-15 TaxID=3418716 RepID=UPI003D082165
MSKLNPKFLKQTSSGRIMRSEDVVPATSTEIAMAGFQVPDGMVEAEKAAADAKAAEADAKAAADAKRSAGKKSTS